MRFSREPPLLWQGPGRLHHAMLSSGVPKSHSWWILCGFFLDLFDRVLFSDPPRFCAQVHGIANDTIKFVQNIINTEINSATDNPVSFHQNLKFHIAFWETFFFLNRCSRWYLPKEERPFQEGISTVNIRLRYAWLWFLPRFKSNFICLTVFFFS